MPQVFTKDPDAVLDYKWDWKASTNSTGNSDWLASGETISAATVTSSVPATLVVDSSSRTDSNTSVTGWLSGGTAGTDYTVVCHITTSAARQDDRTITIKVRER